MLLAILQVHSIGHVHNDVKPDNFRYCPNKGKVFIIDFGIIYKVDV